MQRALELARRGEGFVEPNPMVGCVLVRDGEIVGEGFHRKFGGAHAEVEAIRNAGENAAGSTCYVTLEPCSHYGKTPPCVSAILDAGIRRVVVAMRDPFSEVDGRGLERLRESGVDVTESVLEIEARELNAPYLTRIEKRRPWIIAKWAMTLDGRLASREGDSRWISGGPSRKIVHRLRARMDAILVGSNTAIQDDCLLTVRLDGKDDHLPQRTPIRIVLDSSARISTESRLVRTAKDVPVLIAVAPEASPKQIERLEAAGCEIFRLARKHDDTDLFEHLAARKITNLLVEGGGGIFGYLFDKKLIDEVHAFVAPKLIGGRDAPGPIDGRGIALMENALRLKSPKIEIVDDDVCVRGRIDYSE